MNTKSDDAKFVIWWRTPISKLQWWMSAFRFPTEDEAIAQAMSLALDPTLSVEREYRVMPVGFNPNLDPEEAGPHRVVLGL